MPHPDMNDSWSGGHPDEGLLHEWLDEQLSASDAEQMQAHVASCVECQARAAEARGLMAASHRILSALDDVPANVLPTNFPTLDVVAAKANTGIEKKRTPPKRLFRWQTVGKIAAVLVFAVAIAKSGFLENDVAVPLSAAKNDAAAGAAPAGAIAPVAAAPVTPAPSQVANAEREIAAADRVTAKRVVAEPTAVATRAAAERAMAGGAAAARDVNATAADKRAPEHAKASLADNTSQQTRIAAEAVAPKAELAPPPPTRAEVTSVAELSGRVAGARADAVASALPRADTVSRAASPIATAERRTEMSFSTVVTAADSSLLKNRRSAPNTRLAAGAPMPSAPAVSAPAAVFPASSPAAMAMSANAISAVRSPFDSLTLNRTACTPSCEVTTLHINAAGDVRYAVGVGNTQRVVMSKLSTAAHDSLIALLVRTFPDSVARVGRVSCEQRGTAGTAALQFVIDYALRIPERATIRCTQSAAELQRLSESVDSIAATRSLRLRVRPQD